jgi:hypothetical protein
MTMPTQQRWCHACSKHQDFGSGWYELCISSDGFCVVGPVTDPTYRHGSREDVFACGQTPALVLVERYLHTGTFNPPAPAEPTAQPDQFEALT